MAMTDNTKPGPEREMNDLSEAEVRASARLVVAQYGQKAEEIVGQRIANATAAPDNAAALAWSRIL